MQLFGITEAQHYCSSFTPEGGDAERSFLDFARSNLGSVRLLREGTTLFQQYRSCHLRDAERSLFLAASHYRRCLDLLIPSSSPWSYVTMYYGSWFASKAILEMFGTAVLDKAIVDVRTNAPGSQELAVRKIGTGLSDEPTTYRGSHRQFWDLFYRSVTTVRPLVPSHLSFCLAPVSGNPTWQIDHRNEINYDSFKAIEGIAQFGGAFVPASFPSSLPGFLATQYAILAGLVEVAFLFARQLSLTTDALSLLDRATTRKSLVKSWIYAQKTPRVVSRTKRSIIT